jgi:hypothetical protein
MTHRTPQYVPSMPRRPIFSSFVTVVVTVTGITAMPVD